jgi:formylglycine-generating enzyme required for sulfatase activity
MDDLDKSVNWTNDDLALAELKEAAIDAECDGDLQTALNLWEQVKIVAKNQDNRKRAIKKIEDLTERLNPPQIVPSHPYQKLRSISLSRLPHTFTRREMLYVGFGSMGTVGAIALGLNQLNQPRSPLQPFSFPTVKLTPQGDVIDRKTHQGQQFVGAFDIKMVLIQGGTFKMGAPATERGRSEAEGPQRTVTVSEFFMSQHVVTQAQWKAVSALPKVKVDLKPNPSKLEGDRLPVEIMSLNEAVEFCDRLSVHTGLAYRLPTEAQWEYACRAGTETPFYFGETISTEVANYDGNSTYGAGPKGENLGKTTDVGSYPANGWGLYDMHGNVWEWCLDIWHENYDGAPKADRVWDASNDSRLRVLRGGSWFNYPSLCRSASRLVLPFNIPYLYTYIGFRVVSVSSAPSTL